MNTNEVLKLALEALESMAKTLAEHDEPTTFNEDEAMSALRQALAEPDFWEGYVPEPVKPAQQEPVECQYGKGGYACCEGGPCKADEQNNAQKPAQQEPSEHGRWVRYEDAQRTWVGLPVSAFAGMTLQQASAMKYAELICKEKNT